MTKPAIPVRSPDKRFTKEATRLKLVENCRKLMARGIVRPGAKEIAKGICIPRNVFFCFKTLEECWALALDDPGVGRQMLVHCLPPLARAPLAHGPGFDDIAKAVVFGNLKDHPKAAA